MAGCFSFGFPRSFLSTAPLISELGKDVIVNPHSHCIEWIFCWLGSIFVTQWRRRWIMPPKICRVVKICNLRGYSFLKFYAQNFSRGYELVKGRIVNFHRYWIFSLFWRFEAVTLPDNNQDAELGEIEQSLNYTNTMMGFQETAYVAMVTVQVYSLLSHWITTEYRRKKVMHVTRTFFFFLIYMSQVLENHISRLCISIMHLLLSKLLQLSVCILFDGVSFLF